MLKVFENWEIVINFVLTLENFAMLQNEWNKHSTIFLFFN